MPEQIKEAKNPKPNPLKNMAIQGSNVVKGKTARGKKNHDFLVSLLSFIFSTLKSFFIDFVFVILIKVTDIFLDHCFPIVSPIPLGHGFCQSSSLGNFICGFGLLFRAKAPHLELFVLYLSKCDCLITLPEFVGLFSFYICNGCSTKF